MKMATQAHINPDNLLSSPQDYFFNNNNNNINSFNMYQNTVVYNKLLLQQQQQQQFQYVQQQQQQQQYGFGFSQPSSKRQKFHEVNTGTTTSTTTSEGDDHISLLLEKQRNEIDRFVNLQNERLKMLLQEQRRQQYREIVKRLEERTLQLLKQKDDEIKAASKKTLDLQEMMKKFEIENQTWQRVALENESMVFSLNNTLEQLKQQQQQQQQQQKQEPCSSSACSNVVDDSQSCCNFDDNNNINNNNKVVEKVETFADLGPKTGENKGVFVEEPRKNEGSLCKVCNSRNSTILLLPCRHMCCCKTCDGFLDDCPVCKSTKMASIEALIS